MSSGVGARSAQERAIVEAVAIVGDVGSRIVEALEWSWMDSKKSFAALSQVKVFDHSIAFMDIFSSLERSVNKFVVAMDRPLFQRLINPR